MIGLVILGIIIGLPIWICMAIYFKYDAAKQKSKMDMDSALREAQISSSRLDAYELRKRYMHLLNDAYNNAPDRWK